MYSTLKPVYNVCNCRNLGDVWVANHRWGKTWNLNLSCCT